MRFTSQSLPGVRFVSSGQFFSYGACGLRQLRKVFQLSFLLVYNGT